MGHTNALASEAEPPTDELLRLDAQVAVVTGSGSGIGRAVATRLAGAGAAVLCTDMDADGAAATAEELSAAGWDAAATTVDVRERADAERAAELAVQRWGRIDVLVNNAGVYPTVPVLEMTQQQWDDVLNINTRGALFCSQACAPHLAAAGGGAIVNMASKAADVPTSAMAHYAASKAAVVSLTRSLALDLAPRRIRVNAVSPGAIHTEGSERAAAAMGLDASISADELVAGFVQRCPAGREGTPDEVARVVLFLASPAAAYLTGSVILADGGFLLT